MTEHAINAIEALLHALNNKISNCIIASGLVVAGQTSEKLTPPQYKPLSEIPITDIFIEPQSAGNIISIAGFIFISMQIIVLICKGFAILFKKLKGGY